MKRGLFRILALAALAVFCFFGWRWLHPSAEAVIRQRLFALARAATIPANEGQLLKLANAQKVASFFTTDTEITLDFPGRFTQTISGRNEVQEKALGARSVLNGLAVDFVDVSVTVESGAETALARLTARAVFPGDNAPQVEELKVDLKKVDSEWLIHRAQNVKTLH